MTREREIYKTIKRVSMVGRVRRSERDKSTITLSQLPESISGIREISSLNNIFGPVKLPVSDGL